MIKKSRWCVLNSSLKGDNMFVWLALSVYLCVGVCTCLIILWISLVSVSVTMSCLVVFL